MVEPLRMHNAVNVYCSNASNSIYKIVQDATVADTYFVVYDVSSYVGQTLYFSQSGSTRLRMCQTGSVTAQDFKTLIDGVTTPASAQHTVVQYSNCPWVHDYGSNPSALSNESIEIQQGVTALIVYTGNAEADVELTSVGLGNAFLDTIDQTSVNAVQSNAIYTALNTKANDSDVVHKTGAETVSGLKTFSDGLITGSLFFGSQITAISISGSATWNLSDLKTMMKIVLNSASNTITLPQGGNNPFRFQIIVTQDSTGGRDLSFSVANSGTIYNPSEFDFTSGEGDQLCICTMIWTGNEYIYECTPYVGA